MSELERMIEENISLKKTLQLSRNTQDQLQMQLREVKADLESSQTRCSALSNDFCTLQKKHQNAFVEHTKGVNSLISQVD